MKRNNTSFIKTATCFLGSLLLFSGCQKTQLGEFNTINNGNLPAATKLSALATSPEIRVLSFNVRHNDASDPQSITERQGNIRQIIVDNNPDIFGLQEFSDNSFENWFMPQMASLGYGVYFDESAGMGTPKVIFYKTSRFTLQGSGTVVLGPTNTGTWVKLLDNTTSLKYFVSNSHWQFD
jgi:mRNA deadenylase 3'-5' endonuclease subunit Ccr4